MLRACLWVSILFSVCMFGNVLAGHIGDRNSAEEDIGHSNALTRDIQGIQPVGVGMPEEEIPLHPIMLVLPAENTDSLPAALDRMLKYDVSSVAEMPHIMPVNELSMNVMPIYESSVMPTDKPSVMPIDASSSRNPGYVNKMPTTESRSTTESDYVLLTELTDMPTAVKGPSMPTHEPSSMPTHEPSSMPTPEPSSMPTHEPHTMPTEKPTTMATAKPYTMSTVKQTPMASTNASHAPRISTTTLLPTTTAKGKSGSTAVAASGVMICIAALLLKYV